MHDQKFNVIVPAVLEKGKDGKDWKVWGLASTSNRDLQGETVDLEGLDLTPLDRKKGILNFEHQKGPENVVGAITSYKKNEDGLWLGGYLFKNHDRAKALYQIMTSLKEEDRGRMGLSIEGVIKARAGEDGKVIKRAVITACALTMNPVNQDTHVDLVKSLSVATFNFPDVEDTDAKDKLWEAVHKALGVGSAYASETPGNLTGGDALASEDLDHEPKKATFAKNSEELCADCCAVKSECSCPKGLKKLSPTEFRKSLEMILFQLSELYPQVPKDRLWDLTRDRLTRKFPTLGL